MNNTIAVDFDGTIHKYSKGWLDGHIYDPPTDGCFQALQQLVRDGYEIIIYTCRANSDAGIIAVKQWMLSWMEKTNTRFNYGITSSKPVAKCYIDDRGIRFTNWTDMLNYF